MLSLASVLVDVPSLMDRSSDAMLRSRLFQSVLFDRLLLLEHQGAGLLFRSLLLPALLSQASRLFALLLFCFHLGASDDTDTLSGEELQ